MRHLPNLITLLRILLVGPFLWYLLHDRADLALSLFVIAGVSDGIDGFLAKHFGWTSRLGAILDPLADKALLLAAYGAAAYLGIVPVWLVALVVARDVVILSGAIVYRLLYGAYDMQPLMLSKINTATQLALVVVVVWSMWQGTQVPMLRQIGVYLVALTTISSGAAYVWIWTRRAMTQRSGR